MEVCCPTTPQSSAPLKQEIWHPPCVLYSAWPIYLLITVRPLKLPELTLDLELISQRLLKALNKLQKGLGRSNSEKGSNEFDRMVPKYYAQEPSGSSDTCCPWRTNTGSRESCRRRCPPTASRRLPCAPTSMARRCSPSPR